MTKKQITAILRIAFIEDYGYSNTNYMLISDLIDKTLGYSHQQYIKEEILLPLGLKNTFGSLFEVDIDDVMSGYYIDTIVIQFNNTTNFDGYDWSLAEIIYNRIVKIVRSEKAHNNR